MGIPERIDAILQAVERNGGTARPGPARPATVGQGVLSEPRVDRLPFKCCFAVIAGGGGRGRDGRGKLGSVCRAPIRGVCF